MKNPFTGTIYEDACLSKISFDEDQSEILSKFIDNPKNILYVHSPSGVGKTYFCAAVTNMRFSEKKYCWYMEEKDLFLKLKSEGYDQLASLKNICENEFLILDDLGSTRGNDQDPDKWLTSWQKDVLFSYVDERVKYGLPTIITSNYSIHDLSPIFHERFISRLSAKKNIIMKLKGDDRRAMGL